MPRRTSTEPLPGLKDATVPRQRSVKSLLDTPTERELPATTEIKTEPELPVVKEVDTSPDLVEASGVLAGTSYRVIEELSEGGMGTIYLAEHRELGRRFAIKVLREDMNPTPELVERLRREARAASTVDHPGVVDVTDFGVTARGRPFVVMEHIEGRTLADVLDEEGALEQRRTVVIALSLCEALAAVHAAEFIHRDLKPDNIFLVGEDEQQIKLVDFGLALSPEHFEARLTRHGMVFGTPSYMSPEQVRYQPLTPATDIYSLGVIIYELLTHTVPFEAETAFEVLALKVREHPEPPSARMNGRPLHPGLEQVVLRCLERQPEDRYASVYEVAEALSEVLDDLERHPGGEPSAALVEMSGDDEEVVAPSRRWPVLVGVAVALVVALGSGAALVRWADSDNAGPEPTRADVEATGGPVATTEAHERERANPPMSDSIAPASLELANAAAVDGGSEETTDGGPPPHVLPSSPHRPPASPAARDDRGAPSVADLLAGGQQALRRHQLDEARQAFQRAARLSPGSAAAQAGLGRVAFEQGQYSAAVEHLERALRSRPRDNALRLLLGSTYLRQGQSALAIEQWERILATDPGNRAAQRMLDTVRGRSGGR